MSTNTAALTHSVAIVRTSLARRLFKNPLGLISTIIISIAVLVSIFANLIAPFDPNHTDAMNLMASPNATHWLGTDAAGRDILTRIIMGTRGTLESAILVVITSIVLGVPTGLIAGYYGKTFDAVASWIANMLMSLPSMIVLLAVRAAAGPSILISMAVFGLLIAPGFFRLTRTAVMGVRNELYVDAARVSGLSDSRIILRHILSVVRAPIIIQSAMISGISISIQSGLEFLGLGDPTMVSWGSMLNEGFQNIFVNPLLVMWPGLAITITIGSFALLGNALRDALEDAQKVKLNRKQAKAALLRAKAEVAELQAQSATGSESQASENHLLSVDHLSVGYPQASGNLKYVVQDVSLFVDKGEVLGIVGESGSGKTQTAFSILGLLPDNAKIAGGHIVFAGDDLVAPESGAISQQELTKFRGKRIAYIPQEPMSNLDPAFKIGYQLVRPMTQVLGIGKAEAKAKALALLETVGINNPLRVFNSYPHEISGGMAQRVLIAGAVSCEPDLLIADEPTTALDVTVQAEVLDLLRDLQSRTGMGMVLVTHNFGVVADLADRVVVMQYGRVVETGDVRSILRNPQQDYTKELLSSMLEGKTPMTMLTGPLKGA